MLQTTRLERYSGNGLVAKRNSQNFSKFNEHGAATCLCNCRAISESFLDTLSEMTPNISDIKQKIQTMSEKCPKKKKKKTQLYTNYNRLLVCQNIYSLQSKLIKQ